MYIMTYQPVGTETSITLHGPFETHEAAVEFGQAWDATNNSPCWQLFDTRPVVTWIGEL